LEEDGMCSKLLVMRMIYAAFFLRILGGMACEGLGIERVLLGVHGVRRYTIPPVRLSTSCAV
jgi:hypothetical protein